jgi:hypothetical protein
MSTRPISRSLLPSSSMRSRSTKVFRHALTALALTAGTALLTPVVHAQERAAFSSGPFEGLAGTWSGSGTITMKDGGHERIRCRGTYTVGSGGNSMRQELRCASDSYKFDMSSDVIQTRDQLAGNWTESTRHLAGRVSGRATPTLIHARAEGDTFTALLAVSTHGDHQSVSIQSPGSEVSDVSITMTRGSH